MRCFTVSRCAAVPDCYDFCLFCPFSEVSMVKTISAALVVMALSGAVSASASECHKFFGFSFCSTEHEYGAKDTGKNEQPRVGRQWRDGRDSNEHEGGPAKAPEIDPASALAGLTLLAGGLAVMHGRRAKKSES